MDYKTKIYNTDNKEPNIEIEESFEISLQVLIEGMKQFCVKQQNE